MSAGPAYDPDDDPLMGRLVAVYDRGSWVTGVVAFNDTRALEDGTEVGTAFYRVLWGDFETTEDALKVPRSRQRVRGMDARR